VARKAAPATLRRQPAATRRAHSCIPALHHPPSAAPAPSGRRPTTADKPTTRIGAHNLRSHRAAGGVQPGRGSRATGAPAASGATITPPAAARRNPARAAAQSSRRRPQHRRSGRQRHAANGNHARLAARNPHRRRQPRRWRRRVAEPKVRQTSEGKQGQDADDKRDGDAGKPRGSAFRRLPQVAGVVGPGASVVRARANLTVTSFRAVRVLPAPDGSRAFRASA
jgi:hypothetical protein